MKNHFYFSFFVLLVVALILPCQQVLAQITAEDTTNVVVGDTMYVGWMKSSGEPRVNALRSAIYGDTATDGSRANLNRVYVLKANGYYWESDDIVNTGFPLKLVGQPFDNSGAYPAMLQMTDVRDDGTTSANHLITGEDDVTLKNIYITGCTNANGVQTAYQPITFTANGKTFDIDNCVFTQSNFSLLVWTGANNYITVTNCKFRNLIESPPTQQWTGRGLSIWADQETFIVENCTFFNLGFTCFQMEGGSVKYVRFNHNTIVNLGRSVTSNSGNWWQSAYFTNNLVVNGFWEGECYTDMHGAGRDARMVNSGLFQCATLPSNYGTQESRRVVIAKNYAYLDPLIEAKYGEPDTINRAYFIDPVAKEDYLLPYALGGANQGHMYVADTVWLSSMPAGMTNYLADVNWRAPRSTEVGATMVDSMWAFITQVRTNPPIYTTFFYKPELYYSSQTWPLPENFSYTEASLLTAATDGLPLGDLNWFPAQKATFEAGKAGFVAAIEDLAGQKVVDSVKTKNEAENGTLGGTSTEASTQGLTYYTQDGGAGSITWTFNVPTGKAGLYDTKWYLHMTGRGQSGPVLGIDGKSFVDRAFGWGQFVLDPTKGPAAGTVNDAWVWVPIVADSMMLTDPWGDAATSLFTFTEGEHTIGVMNGGWGTVRFAEIDLALHGDADTIKLKAPDAATVLVTPGAEGVNWVASAFKFVNLGSAGTITMNFTTEVAGTYKFRIFGQNVSGAGKTITMKEGSTVLASPVLPCKMEGTTPDDAGNDVSSTTFSLAAGDHTIELSGSDVAIDYVQLIKQDIVTGVDGENGIPGKFALSQNYPNPFNPATTINFTLSKASNVKLTVYNILGQRVATLVNGHMNAGQQQVVFDASRFASGVYFYRLDAGGNFNSVKKMLLLK